MDDRVGMGDQLTSGHFFPWGEGGKLMYVRIRMTGKTGQNSPHTIPPLPSFLDACSKELWNFFFEFKIKDIWRIPLLLRCGHQDCGRSCCPCLAGEGGGRLGVGVGVLTLGI